MAQHKYPECDDCLFNNHESESICEECVNASEYVPADSDSMITIEEEAA